jgi:beta-aspartyl-peptidase (threonine type)
MPLDGRYALAVHGGAGTVTRALLGTEREAAYRAGLAAACAAGTQVLAAGGSALDAVLAAVCVLEDDPLFNAGRGSVYTAAGTHEMDAAVMQGHTLQAGAVAGVTRLRNPARAAEAVLRHSPHVLLAGAAAEAFALAHGVESAATDYFHEPLRWRQLQEARAEGSILLDHAAPATLPEKFGTVGAVARDVRGHLAAATSTGGMTCKLPGRIGDSPLIGAGTYADDQVALSATGSGEHFIRAVAAYDVAARMRYRGESVATAVEGTLRDRLGPHGGKGGLIAVDAAGRVHMGFNSEGMYRAAIDAEGRQTVAIYRDEAPPTCG